MSAAKKAKPWNGVHHKLADEDHCARCGRLLKKEGAEHWLELNSHTGDYRDATMPPFSEKESQGWFGFGALCAALTMGEQAARSKGSA